MTFVADLEPQRLWRHFDALLAIPRASGKEAAARAYVVSLATAAGLEHRADAAGNLVVRKPGAGEGANAPAVCLQTHLDMVCEKNSGTAFDFARDAIAPRRVEGYLHATGTTLGADNGIGVASALAVLEAKDLVHPPLELLFTVEEETGLVGATKLDPALLTAPRLLNLDTEEEASVYIGCAGAGGSEIALPLETMFPAEGRTTIAARLFGLKGGHSGVDIHLQRGNALQLLGRALFALAGPFEFELAGFAGGNMANAIPREAEAIVSVPAAEQGAFTAALAGEVAKLRGDFAPTEPDLAVETRPAAAPRASWTPETATRALGLLVGLPHGVVTMSRDIPDLVETSTNLARATVDGETLKIAMSSRSSSEAGLAGIRAKIRAIAALAGAEVAESAGYPGWKPDLASPLLAHALAVAERVYGRKPAVKAIHAGLECGVLGEKRPGIDRVSIGPQIEFPHSPDERVEIGSVARFWELLVALLADLSHA